MWRRAVWAGLVAAVGLLSGCQDGGLLPTAAQADQRPGRLAKLPDGRAINLRCEGRGSPTVLMDAGFGGNSGAWWLVQPKVARETRVCAYDRAGYGFSDPGPLPRDGAAVARDLDLALTAAGIDGPFVVVGHSAGGLYARLFAARRPGEIQGLVLVDPTVEQRAATPGERDGLDGIRRRVRRCLATAETTPAVPQDDPAWVGCIGKKPSAQDWIVAKRPDTWRGQLSELDTMFGRTSEEVMRLGDLLKAVPIYVLTASDTAAAADKVGYDHPQSVWELQHLRLALSSEHGSQRTVLSSHLIMIDRPEVVADAVLAMVRAGRAGQPPEALPASEGPQPGDQPFAPETPITK